LRAFSLVDHVLRYLGFRRTSLFSNYNYTSQHPFVVNKNINKHILWRLDGMARHLPVIQGGGSPWCGALILVHAA
jgi:hypothetical protein